MWSIELLLLEKIVRLQPLVYCSAPLMQIHTFSYRIWSVELLLLAKFSRCEYCYNCSAPLMQIHTFSFRMWSVELVLLAKFSRFEYCYNDLAPLMQIHTFSYRMWSIELLLLAKILRLFNCWSIVQPPWCRFIHFLIECGQLNYWSWQNFRALNTACYNRLALLMQIHTFSYRMWSIELLLLAKILRLQLLVYQSASLM